MLLRCAVLFFDCWFLCMCSVLSYLILYDPVDCSPPGSSAHGNFHARILVWVAISFSMGSSWSVVEPMSLASPPLAADLHHCATWKPLECPKLHINRKLLCSNIRCPREPWLYLFHVVHHCRNFSLWWTNSLFLFWASSYSSKVWLLFLACLCMWWRMAPFLL